MAAPDTLQILGTPYAEQDLDSTTNATVYSSTISTKYAPNWSIHYQWTKVGGTGATSTITLWASNIREPDASDDTDWVQNTDVTFTDPADDSGKALIEVGNSGAKHYRLKIVTASGTSTIKAFVHGKSARSG